MLFIPAGMQKNITHNFYRYTFSNTCKESVHFLLLNSLDDFTQKTVIVGYEI